MTGALRPFSMATGAPKSRRAAGYSDATAFSHRSRPISGVTAHVYRRRVATPQLRGHPRSLQGGEPAVA